MIDLSGVKNIIFDFGGVLYDIDMGSAERKFSQILIHRNKDVNLRNLDLGSDFFSKFETGDITVLEFRQKIRELLEIDLNDAFIDSAWNSILNKLFADSPGLIKEFNSFFNTALLSNTNDLHYDAFIVECREFLKLFDHTFFSHKIGLRKPDQEIFEHVIKKTGFIPGETLFLDDSEINIKGAESLGLNTMIIKSHDEVSDLLHSVKLLHKSGLGGLPLTKS